MGLGEGLPKKFGLKGGEGHPKNNKRKEGVT